MLLLGVDLGSSSIKLTVVDGATDTVIAETSQPPSEMPISAPSQGFAEQNPDMWWQYFCQGLEALRIQGTDTMAIEAIGFAYQMHGLVCVDKHLKPVRPAIIWCDSRAVEIGKSAAEHLGTEYCFEHLLNEPGNFTASKLRWVQQNEPHIFSKIAHVMLPGDYLASKLCQAASTTEAGLSEGILWDYQAQSLASELLSHWDIDKNIIAPVVPQFGLQGRLNKTIAQSIGLSPDAAVTYRAGDQPNNALSLNALREGDIVATAGTSAVMYASSNAPASDRLERINTFLNPAADDTSAMYGALMCINGGARAFAWLRQLLGQYKYARLNDIAAEAPIGSDGLLFLPFGNGAERLFGSQSINASWLNLDFNRHQLAHMVRSVQEGVACALRYGFDVMQTLGIKGQRLRASNNNLFLSKLFAQTVANLTRVPIELCDTSGAEGAARAAGIGIGYYKNSDECFANLKVIRCHEPSEHSVEAFETHYKIWLTALHSHFD